MDQTELARAGKRQRLTAVVFLMVGGILLSGCATIAAGDLPAIKPGVPSSPRSIEYSIGDFEFTLSGPKTSDAQSIALGHADRIFKRWETSGYVAGRSYVPNSGFTGRTQLAATLSGSHRGKSNGVARIVSGVTLYLVPYSLSHQLNLELSLERPGRIGPLRASASDGYRTLIWALLLPTAPWLHQRGREKTLDRLADHLYEQLRLQGAFD